MLSSILAILLQHPVTVIFYSYNSDVIIITLLYYHFKLTASFTFHVFIFLILKTLIKFSVTKIVPNNYQITRQYVLVSS